MKQSEIQLENGNKDKQTYLDPLVQRVILAESLDYYSDPSCTSLSDALLRYFFWKTSFRKSRKRTVSSQNEHGYDESCRLLTTTLQRLHFTDILFDLYFEEYIILSLWRVGSKKKRWKIILSHLIFCLFWKLVYILTKYFHIADFTSASKCNFYEFWHCL